MPSVAIDKKKLYPNVVLNNKTRPSFFEIQKVQRQDTF